MEIEQDNNGNIKSNRNEIVISTTTTRQEM